MIVAENSFEFKMVIDASIEKLRVEMVSTKMTNWVRMD